MDISVIVPVFNVEKYLIRCLDSIFNQDFSGDFEVIAVDDASTDNSLQILKNYQNKEARLKVVEHKENKRLTVTRFDGIHASIGDYIMHVDSDDWILPNTFEILFAKCKETNSDVLVFNYLRQDQDGNQTFYKHRILEEICTTDKFEVQNHFLYNCWNKIVKREIVLELVIGSVNVNVAEDLLYATEVLLKSDRICLFPEVFYVYCYNSKSIIQTTKCVDILYNKVNLLVTLKIIYDKYMIESTFFKNILIMLETETYTDLMNLQMSNESFNIHELIKAFSLTGLMTLKQIKSLNRAIDNRFYCIYKVAKCSGLKEVVARLLRS